MSKSAYIYISVAFFVASLYLSLVKNDNYLQTLNDKEYQKYKLVVEERMRIYLIANVSALLVVGLLYFSKVRLDNQMNNAWMYVAIFFLIEYFVYTLHPKTHWMLDSVETKQDVQDWLEKYKYMKINWHIGLLLGVLAVGIFSYFSYNNDNNNVDASIEAGIIVVN